MLSNALFRCAAIATDPRLEYCDTAYSSNVYVKVIHYVQPVAQMSGDSAACVDVPAEFTATGAVNEGDYYLWYRNDVLAPSNGANFILDSIDGRDESILVTVKIRNDENICVKESVDSMRVNVYPGSKLVMLPDTVIQMGDTADVGVTVIGNSAPYS